MLEDIKEFNNHFGIPMLPSPGFLSDEDMKRRLDFQLEELEETAHAAGFFLKSLRHGTEFVPIMNRDRKEERSLPEVLDGLVDQIYVALGTAAKMGFLSRRIVPGALPGDKPIEEFPRFQMAWNRVHQANMQKEKTPGLWRLTKPKGWVRPDLGDLCK